MKELLSFQDLYYKFDNNQRFVKESGILFSSQVLVLQGPSGAGKSTLLKILARLIKPDSATVFFQGKDWKTFSPNEWRLNINYVAQQPIIFEGSVKDNLLLPYNLKLVSEKKQPPTMEIIEDYLERLGLSTKILNQSAKTLSGGEKARIAILRAVLLEPKILLLDEPSAYLDGENKEIVMSFFNDWLMQDKRGIAMVTHSQKDLNYINNYTTLNITPRRHEIG
ncbi:MAG TPA: ATP-binding cassette domain-containing protein [Syntrophomonadaceae bacterium]|nr:ATP-binding cassette domain-containing protein [Syntrophomonadaceae bacterium]